MFNAEEIKKDFPILGTKMNGKPLVYLDNAATSQKPECVIKETERYYSSENANVHRGVYMLAEIATGLYESTRLSAARFIGAVDGEQQPLYSDDGDIAEIIFTRGTTEAINMVAYSWGDANVAEGDEILVSMLEHHSNLVPWQQLCKRKSAKLRFIPVDENGELILDSLDDLITEKTKMVAVSMVSNALGTITPIKEIVEKAKRAGAVTLVDGAQAAPHMPVNVRDLDCDFFAFSAHKMLGPTGLGVLYGKKKILEEMNPFLFGGDMIREVGLYDSTWNSPPHKFEAGTPNIAGVAALTPAIEYLLDLGMENVFKHSTELRDYAVSRLRELPKIHIYAEHAKNVSGIVSFTIKGAHAHDIASVLAEDNVAIRAGHHCAQPLMNLMGESAMARMSFYIYNTREDVDRAVEAIKKVYEIFKIS